VVTRAASDHSLGVDIGKQMFKTARPLWIVSGVLLALALIPGMPKISFIALGGITMFAAWKMKPGVSRRAAACQGRRGGKGGGTPAVDPMDAVLKLDDLMLEVGVGLVPLVDAKQGGQLLARVKSLRKNLAQQLGFLVPSIHITDNLSLKEREYVIYLRGVEIARWEMRRDRCSR
jgi:flagellar biosynthesis protein FlhA